MSEKCVYAKYCGGCKYQGIEYKKQLEIKQEYINSLLKQFGKVEPILGLDNPNNYRNKAQVSFGYDEAHHVICGNYVTSSHTIVPIEKCMIVDENINKIIDSVKRLIIKHHINIFDERVLKGCMRHLLVKSSNLNEYMVVLVTGSVSIKNEELFVKDIIKYNPNVKTIIQNINNKHTSMILSDKNRVLYGKGYILDELCGLKFQISASSFYQVNKYQTKVLYSKAKEYARLNKNETLIDAYCGTGTIGLIMADSVKSVIGVEVNKSAIKDAIKNARNNNIKNVEFICDDASNFMYRLSKAKTNIDVLIMDPPRAGADMKFLKATISLMPKKIVYISCGPQSLKENLQYLTKYYKIDKIQPVDMFPYTEHIETIVLMSTVKK